MMGLPSFLDLMPTAHISQEAERESAENAEIY